MGKRPGPVRYQAALLAVPYLATLVWSLLTPRQPLSALSPYLLALSHTSGTWHPLLIFLYSTEAKNKKEKKTKGWLATVCQTGSSAEGTGQGRDSCPVF